MQGRFNAWPKPTFAEGLVLQWGLKTRLLIIKTEIPPVVPMIIYQIFNGQIEKPTALKLSRYRTHNILTEIADIIHSSAICKHRTVNSIKGRSLTRAHARQANFSRSTVNILFIIHTITSFHFERSF